jgi:2-amino-4-hydroxy-6-hydroxymethyldihydropteridine diphosphokinase
VVSPPAVAYVGVGSNLQPERNIERALEGLLAAPGVSLTAISTFYRTAALSDPDNTASLLDSDLSTPESDPDFLNGVLAIRTFLSPGDLLGLFHAIETGLGREREYNRYAPRTMDLDLLLYGKVTFDESDPEWLEIGIPEVRAHRDIERRAFVALPLLELAPELILPPYRTPLRAFAASFETPAGKAETAFSENLRERFLTP